MKRCAQCKSRVEDGAVRCPCGADLSNPGAFFQVIGWVLVAISSIPLGLGVVLEGEHDHFGLIGGGAALLAGLILVVAGTARSRSQEARVIGAEDTEPAAGEAAG